MAKIARIKNRHTKLKGANIKRWAKGHSSDSNPTITKHREIAARSRFVINASNDDSSTKKSDRKIRFKLDKSLHKPEKMMEHLSLNDAEENGNDSENEDISSAETAETKFSRFTNCTNPTFNKVHRMWKSGSELQNDVLTVLAAVTEVIKKVGGQETEVEYFAALVGSLSNPDQPVLPLSATVYLLSLVIRRVPYAVLVKSFSQTCMCLYNFLLKYTDDSEANALVRYTLDCLGVIMKAQPHQIFDAPSTAKLFETLLSYTLDERPKIRKTAQKAISGILYRENAATVHPAAKICAKFLTDTINRCGGDSKLMARTCHALNLLAVCIPNMNAVCFKSSAESVLQLCTVCPQPVWREAIGCLRKVLADCSPRAACLPLDVNMRLIAALYDFAPDLSDSSARCIWAQAQLEAHRCLADSDVTVAARASTRLLQQVVDLLAGADQSAVSGLVIVIRQILNDCFGQELNSNKTISSTVAVTLKNLLSLKYFAIWPQCFDILSSFFKLSLVKCDGVKELLKSLGELRESENFAHIVTLDKCLGSAIRHLGPEPILNAIPLQMNNLDFGDVANSWLLPLLRQNVQQAPLRHFVHVFLPVAAQIRNRLAAMSPNQEAKRRFFESLQQQIWELLPAYCMKPVDLETNLKDVAKMLGTLLTDTPNLRLIVLSCLRNLILKSESSLAKNEMTRYAPNYLPILFQIFLQNDPKKATSSQLVAYDAKGVRLACLETIRVYLTITPSSQLRQYMDVALTKLNDTAESVDKRHRVFDLLVAMVKHLSDDDVAKMFGEVKGYCSQTKDKSLQKKAFRVLEEAFNCETVAAAKFFSKHKATLLEILTLKLEKASPSTKAAKIRCLTKLVENKFLTLENGLAMLDDVVLCLKEDNVKTRRSAAIFFVTMSNLIIADQKNIQDGAEKIWHSLWLFFDDVAGEHFRQQCCALIAARLFAFEFKNDAPSSLIGIFLSKICQLIKTQNRQVTQCCLEFLKTLVACSSQILLGQFLDTILLCLFTQNDDCQRHFRFLTRKILAKLLRKFPFELVKKHVPDQFQKQLNNVRKALQRYEKRKTLGISKSADVAEDDDVISGITGLSRPETIADLLKDTSDEESDEDDPNFDTKSRKSTSWQSAKRVFLHENEEILDFLDIKKSMKMIKNDKNMGKKIKKVENHGFKLDDNGRLIIGNEEDDMPGNPESGYLDLGKRKKADQDELKPMKRKKTGLVKDDEGDSDLDEALHYKSGGGGIHRDIEQNDEKQAKRKAGEKFKAKKAKGDVTKCGTQPYAYIPLDFKQLNKRKRAKSEGIYKNLVHGAKKGASKGTKGRRKIKK